MTFLPPDGAKVSYCIGCCFRKYFTSLCLLDEDEIDTNADASISASKTIEAKNKDTTADHEQSKILSKNLPPPNKRVRTKSIIIIQ